MKNRKKAAKGRVEEVEKGPGSEGKKPGGGRKGRRKRRQQE